jgi:pimeloyl-[acyl-carrier protein] methyl ester esterase
MKPLFVEQIGSGPSLTLLHGWGLNGAVWYSIRNTLAEHFTLHLIDLPGHGYSQHIPINTLSEAAEHVARVMPPRGHLLGFSLGGQFAITLACLVPDQIDKLILVSATPQFIANPDWPYGKKATALDQFATNLKTNYHATIREFLALQILNHPNQRATIAELQTAVSARGAPDLVHLTAGLELLKNNNLRDQVQKIRHKTLVIQGDRDALTSERAGQWLATQIPSSQYEMIAFATHAPFLSHRDIFLARMMQFLNS